MSGLGESFAGIVTDGSLLVAMAVAALVAAAAPYRLDASAEAGGARLAAKGSIADPRTLGGADLALTAQVPDLAALAPLARRPLPAWRDIAGGARMLTAPEGPSRGVALRSIALRSPLADLAGEAALDRGGRPALRARLASDRVDLDALLTALPARPVQPPAVEPVTAAPPAPPQIAEPARPAGSGRLFSDRPIPFDLLRLGDADLSVAIAALLAANPKPSDADIRGEITNICRCGTYNRVQAAIKRAAGGEANG